MNYALLIFFIAMDVKLAIDVRLHQKNKRNQHLSGAIIVFAALAACTWLVGWRSVDMWYFGYWASFDTMFALLIGENWYYVGKSARLDKLQRKYPVIVGVKYIFAIFSIIFYFI